MSVENKNKRILYKNGDIIIASKLPLELCESQKHKETDVLLCDLIKQELNLSDSSFVECVNRLDQNVSGCVMICLSKNAFTKCSEFFKSKEKVKKKYWTIVEKPENSKLTSLLPTNETVFIENYIQFNSAKKKSFIRSIDFDLTKDKNARKWKKAKLSYKTLALGERYAFLEVCLFTGRTHQIRAQLSSIGLFIKGDVKYGAKRKDSIPGIRLHAYSLEFFDEETKKMESVSCLPPFIDNLWQAFIKESQNG